MAEQGDPDAVLHLRTPELLMQFWPTTPVADRTRLINQRPLLAQIDQAPHKLKRLLLIERLLWQMVDKERYRVYHACWREFARRSPALKTILEIHPFPEQHQHLLELCHTHGLENDPLGKAGRDTLLNAARREVMEVAAATEAEIQLIQPSIEELLP